MNSKIAFDLISNKFPKSKVVSCVEYDSAYSFYLLPKDVDDSERRLTSLIGVNKRTCEIFHFTPMAIPLSEYKRGIKVDISSLTTT